MTCGGTDTARTWRRALTMISIATAIVVCLVIPGGLAETTASPETPNRKVTIPPLIVSEPAKMIAFRVEESIELPCVATGEPQPLYKWKMNDKDFDPSGNDGRIAIQPGVGTLIFARPLERDEAIYQCLAQNQVGIALTVKIDLRQAYLDPFQTSGTREHRPHLGESLTLSCTPPRSFPKPDIFWATISGGERFTPIDLTDRVTMDPIGNLHFVNIELDDFQGARTYACIVQNQVMRSIQQGEYAKVIPQGQMPIYMPPEILWQSPTHQVSLRSQTWRVKCIFSGSPTPRVDWSRVDADMPSGRWRQESFGQELVIENVQLEDIGKYECQGINDDSSVPMRRSFDLAVEAAPYWIDRPASVDGAEGDKAEFDCYCQGIPDPVNFWYINGQPVSILPEDPRRMVEQRKLTYYNLTTNDAMVIQCNSTNKHGYQYANAYLNVLSEPPIILTPPMEEQVAAETQIIELPCEVFGSPKPLVIWRKGSEQLTGGRYKVLDQGNLQIEDVMLVDAGVYTCTATNMFDTVSATGSLIVRRKTQIQTPPQDVMIYEGTEAKLTCTATTDPAEVKNLVIDWKKDGQFIDYELAQRVFKNDMDNSLTISGTMSLDTGKYTCVASNGIDEDEYGAQLTVQAPPDPPSDVWVQCYSTDKMAEIYWQPGRENYAPILNFIVQFNTSFNPDTWYDIADNVSQNVRNAKVQLSPYANYTFRILARNKIGLSNPSLPTADVCRLTTAETPDKNPENVMGEGDLPDNLVIFWTPMSPIEYNGDRLTYIVSWKRADVADGVESSETVDDPSLWFHVVQQPVDKPYTPFYIRVKAHNAVGDAKVEPKWLLGYSGEGEPLAAPANVAIVEGTVTDTEANLRWDQVNLDPDIIQGFFRGYRVQFARQSEWPDNIRDVDYIFNKSYQYPRPRERRAVDEVQVILTHLPPNSAIRCQVRVLNKYYAGPPSQQIEFQTDVGEPGPPASLDVIQRGSTHFELQWQPPIEPNGDLVGYQISYQTVTGLNLGRMKFREPLNDPAATQAKLTGLQPSSFYRVYLAGMTVKGQGEPIFLDMKTLPPGPPSPPTFMISDLNDTYVNVTWEPSTAPNPGSIFYVEYRQRNLYQWEQTPDEYLLTYLIIYDLEPGTIYQVRVVAKNGDGLEAPAEYQEVRTEGLPAYNFRLGTSMWFWGIWIAMCLLIALLILFFFAKRYTDKDFSSKEFQIEDQVRELQAEEFAKQMMDNDLGSTEFLNTSQASAAYSEDDEKPYFGYEGDDDVYNDIPEGPPYNGEIVPPYNGVAESVPPYNGYSSGETKRPLHSNSSRRGAALQNDEPLPVHAGYDQSSSSRSVEHIGYDQDTSYRGRTTPEPTRFVAEGYKARPGAGFTPHTPEAKRAYPGGVLPSGPANPAPDRNVQGYPQPRPSGSVTPDRGSRSRTPEPGQYALNTSRGPSDTFV